MMIINGSTAFFFCFGLGLFLFCFSILYTVSPLDGGSVQCKVSTYRQDKTIRIKIDIDIHAPNMIRNQDINIAADKDNL
jgi:hypothetical protein